MAHETCPLLDEIPWLKHGFFGRDPFVPNTHTEKETDSSFLKKLGLNTGELYFCRHVFEDRIITPYDWHLGIEADAWVTSEEHKALAVKTADCVPLLLACTKSRLIAAVHVSWHCVLKNIVPKTVKRLQGDGATPETIIAAIGPCIHQASYPVRQDLHDRFVLEAPEHLPFLKKNEDNWLLDVPGMVISQLMRYGVEKIWQSSVDVHISSNHYSYRKTATDPASATLRNVSLIVKINP